MAPDVWVLALGRIICGFGLAAGLMAMIKASSQWYPKERMAAATGAGLFLAGMGGMAATVPVQWAVPLLGWRGIKQVTSTNFTPEETIAAVKEDVEWAKTRLLRRG